MLVSDVPGNKRFAMAVARRLATLGALTQGDRRATGSANALGLANVSQSYHSLTHICGVFVIFSNHGC